MSRTAAPPTELTLEATEQVLEGNDKAMLERPDTLIVQLEKDPWTGLTDRQKQIQEMRMRGMSQVTMGKILGISQPMVNKELKSIQKCHAERGVAVDKNSYAGETVSIYEELFSKALRCFYEIPKDNPLGQQMKLQAINTMASMREKQTKLLMDLGIIDKASTKIEHSLKSSSNTFVDSWSTTAKQKLANNLLEAEFEELANPVPPEPEEGELIEEEDA